VSAIYERTVLEKNGFDIEINRKSRILDDSARRRIDKQVMIHNIMYKY